MIIDQSTMKIIANTAAKKIKARIRAGGIKPPSNNGGRTLIKSGKLINSIKYRTQGQKVIISAGGGLKYAAIQHQGGVIRPRKAKYLAIPLTKAAQVKSPRDFENTYIHKGVIFLKVDGGKDIALYALKKSVTLPARPYMYLTDAEMTDIHRILGKEMLKNGTFKTD